MPIYEYQCQACQHTLEKIQKISDAPLTDCPNCHAPALKKKISAAAFRLSGSGWYETDFKKGGAKKNLVDNGTQSAGGEKSDSSPSKEAKSDAPAAKAASGNSSNGSANKPSTKKE